MRLLILSLCLLCVCTLKAQEVIVLSEDTEDPLFNVAVFNLDKSKSSVTDFNGSVSLKSFTLTETIIFKHLAHKVFKVCVAHPTCYGLRCGRACWLRRRKRTRRAEGRAARAPCAL